MASPFSAKASCTKGDPQACPCGAAKAVPINDYCGHNVVDDTTSVLVGVVVRETEPKGQQGPHPRCAVVNLVFDVGQAHAAMHVCYVNGHEGKRWIQCKCWLAFVPEGYCATWPGKTIQSWPDGLYNLCCKHCVPIPHGYRKRVV